MRPIEDIQRTVAPFKVESDFSPSGDQPSAIAELEERMQRGEQDVVHERALARARDSGHAHQPAEREGDVHVLEVVGARAEHLDDAEVRIVHLAPDRRIYNKGHLPGAAFTDLDRDRFVNDAFERIGTWATTRFAAV